jgi:hypothetical protein
MSSIPQSAMPQAKPGKPKRAAKDHGGSSGGKLQKLGYGLGAFSIALGAVELLAGRRVARSLGVEKASPVVRGFGLREIATGAALLAGPTSARNVWLRVAGDVLDAGALGGALRARRAKRGMIWGGLAFVGTALLADIAAGVAMQRSH